MPVFKCGRTTGSQSHPPTHKCLSYTKCMKLSFHWVFHMPSYGCYINWKCILGFIHPQNLRGKITIFPILVNKQKLILFWGTDNPPCRVCWTVWWETYNWCPAFLLLKAGSQSSHPAFHQTFWHSRNGGRFHYELS